MSIEECYEKMGGSYADVIARLSIPRIVEKFIGKFLEDDSFDVLCRQMECGNRAEAFRAAHTLKGVCANLSFSRLWDSAARLTEELRTESDSISDRAVCLFEEVHRDDDLTTDAIRQYRNQQ